MLVVQKNATDVVPGSIIKSNISGKIFSCSCPKIASSGTGSGLGFSEGRIMAETSKFAVAANTEDVIKIKKKN
ncbi:MAG: hypothetical protein QME57_01470 [Patescibacteria group bacterium]|nr:hypothetical protein [Patescibacteria group bacterium]